MILAASFDHALRGASCHSRRSPRGHKNHKNPRLSASKNHAAACKKLRVAIRGFGESLCDSYTQKVIMTDITQDIKDGLNLALNEANIVGLDFDKELKTVYLTLYPIAIQQDGTIPDDNRFLFAFRNVGRLASSLTLDTDKVAIKFNPNELANHMNEFKNESLYGWEFIDNDEELIFKQWKENMSFDTIINADFEKQHTIDLFQEDKYSKKTIDIRIWFDTIEIFDSNLKPFDTQTFIDNGKRGWDKLYKDGWSTTEAELKGKLKLHE